jgi:hypothetical protein
VASLSVPVSGRCPTPSCARSYGFLGAVARLCAIATQRAILSFCALCSTRWPIRSGFGSEGLSSNGCGGRRRYVERGRCFDGIGRVQTGCRWPWFSATPARIPPLAGPRDRHGSAAYCPGGRRVAVRGLGRGAFGVLDRQFAAIDVVATHLAGDVRGIRDQTGHVIPLFGPGQVGSHLRRVPVPTRAVARRRVRTPPDSAALRPAPDGGISETRSPS